MDEEKKITNIENNILNEEAVLKKEEKKVQEISKELSEGKNPVPSNSFKDKAINWLKEPSNLALVAVMIFAIGIRFYYFWITKNQPLWWDELCYGSLAKNFITHAWDGTSLIISETHIRPLIFSYLWAFLMLFSLGEVANRFLLVFVPSVLSVFFIYLVGKEIYNKKVGLIAAAIFSVIWLNLFYNSRFLVHMLELCFLFSSLYFFVRATKSELNFKQFCLSLILLSLATLTRYQDGMVFFIYLIILLLGKKLYLNRLKFWYSGIIGLSPLLLFFLINFINYGSILPALFGGDYIKPAAETVPFAFNLLNYIPIFLTTIFFIAFIMGFCYLLLEIFLGYNLFFKNQKLRNSLLLLLIMLVFFSFFIFFMRGAEDRWLFEVLSSLAIISAVGIDLCAKYIEKYSKWLGILFIIGVLIFGAYAQINYADSLIKQKKDSYLQMRQAFEWIKINTPEQSVILGAGIEPYAVYYSDRQYLQLPQNDSNGIGLEKADYLVAHSFIPQTDYLNQYIQDNQKSLEPVNAFFFDTQKQQSAVIVYKINKNETSSTD